MVYYPSVGGLHWSITMADMRRLCQKHGVPAKVVKDAEYDGGSDPTIILLSDEPIGHYVCTWGDRYFDPYGDPPPPGINKRHETLPLQRQEFLRGGRILDINTCGKHCIMRLKHRDKTQVEYRRILGSHPDLTVAINI